MLLSHNVAWFLIVIKIHYIETNDYDTCTSEDCESNDVVYEFEEQFRNTDLMHSESDDGGSDSGFLQS